MKEQILAKLKEEKLVEKLFACESIEQVQELFKDSGVEKKLKKLLMEW